MENKKTRKSKLKTERREKTTTKKPVVFLVIFASHMLPCIISLGTGRINVNGRYLNTDPTISQLLTLVTLFTQ